LQSNSKMATPGIIGQRHYNLAQEIKQTLAQYEDLKDIIAMLGLEQLSTNDRNLVNRARRLERFLTQPFFTTEQFSGISGKYVSLKEALDGCERILSDEFKDLPESAFYMIGNIEEAQEKEKKDKEKEKSSETEEKKSSESEKEKSSETEKEKSSESEEKKSSKSEKEKGSRTVEEKDSESEIEKSSRNSK